MSILQWHLMTRNFAKLSVKRMNKSQSEVHRQAEPGFKFSDALKQKPLLSGQDRLMCSNSYPDALALMILWIFQANQAQWYTHAGPAIPETVPGRSLGPSSWRRVWEPYLCTVLCLCNWVLTDPMDTNSCPSIFGAWILINTNNPNPGTVGMSYSLLRKANCLSRGSLEELHNEQQ